MKLDGRLVDEANVEDYMTQQGELFQTELLAKYGFTLVTLQSKMAQAQADPEFANNLNELTVVCGLHLVEYIAFGVLMFVFNYVFIEYLHMSLFSISQMMQQISQGTEVEV